MQMRELQIFLCDREVGWEGYFEAKRRWVTDNLYLSGYFKWGLFKLLDREQNNNFCP